MQTITRWFAAVHNWYTDWPLWAKNGTNALWLVLLAVVAGFGWWIPGTWPDVLHEFNVFMALLVPALWAVFQAQLLPYLIQWILQMLALIPEHFTQHRFGLKRAQGHWRMAIA